MTIRARTSVMEPHPAPEPKQGLDFVGQAVDHDPDDDLIQQVVDAVASGDKGCIIESASRLAGRKPADDARLAQLLSVEEVAMNLTISTRSVWRLVASGNLPQPIRVGHVRRWHATDVTAYLKRLTEKRDGIQRRSHG